MQSLQYLEGFQLFWVDQYHWISSDTRRSARAKCWNVTYVQRRLILNASYSVSRVVCAIQRWMDTGTRCHRYLCHQWCTSIANQHFMATSKFLVPNEKSWEVSHCRTHSFKSDTERTKRWRTCNGMHGISNVSAHCSMVQRHIGMGNKTDRIAKLPTRLRSQRRDRAMRALWTTGPQTEICTLCSKWWDSSHNSDLNSSRGTECPKDA